MAKMLWHQRSGNGILACEVLDYGIWGPGDVAERISIARHETTHKLPHRRKHLGRDRGLGETNRIPPTKLSHQQDPACARTVASSKRSDMLGNSTGSAY